MSETEKLIVWLVGELSKMDGCDFSCGDPEDDPWKLIVFENQPEARAIQEILERAEKPT